MMGRLNHDQEQLLYSFHLDEAVPHDHPVRKIAAVLDLSWVHSDLAPFYPKMGRPSIDPELMIRMLIIGYVFAIRSERAICRDVQVNLPPAWPGRSRPGARLRSVVLHRNERWSVEVHGQDFEQHVDHRVIGLVENCVIDIARFEKEIAWPVDDCFVRQDVSHVARRDLPDSRSDMVVLPNVSAGSQRQFGNAKLILSIDLAQKARERSFE